MISEVVKCWQQNNKCGTVIIVLPKTIRDAIGVKANDRFVITYDSKKRIILKKVDMGI